MLCMLLHLLSNFCEDDGYENILVQASAHLTQVQEFWNRCPHVESCGTQVSTDTVAVSNSDWLQLSIMAVRSTFDNVETPFARRLFSRFLLPASHERKELAHFFC